MAEVPGARGKEGPFDRTSIIFGASNFELLSNFELVTARGLRIRPMTFFSSSCNYQVPCSSTQCRSDRTLNVSHKKFFQWAPHADWHCGQSFGTRNRYRGVKKVRHMYKGFARARYI